MSYSNSGFRSSSFNSDFGTDFATKSQDSITINHIAFPKGPTIGSEMTDMYCASRTNETFADFVKHMNMLHNHTKVYMDAVDKNDYRQMVSALTAVPDIAEIKMHLFIGKTGKQVCDFYTSKMIIRR